MPNNNIVILHKRVGKLPYLTEKSNDLKSSQELVGGLIDVVRLHKDIDMVINDEGKVNGSEPNFSVPGDVIFGDVFFCGSGATTGNFTSLSPKHVANILNYFDWSLDPVASKEFFDKYAVDE